MEEEHGDVNLLLEPLEAEVALNDEYGEEALMNPVVYLQTWIPLISENDKGKWTTVLALHSAKVYDRLLLISNDECSLRIFSYSIVYLQFRTVLEKFHK